MAALLRHTSTEQHHTRHDTQACRSSSSRVGHGGVPYGYVRRRRRGGGFRREMSRGDGYGGGRGRCSSGGVSGGGSVVANVMMSGDVISASIPDLPLL